MPSPFPGMDPYIEDPEIWSDFHAGLATEIRSRLNAQILPRYVARITPRVTYEIIEIEEKRLIKPDIGVWQPAPATAAGLATAATFTPPIESLVTFELPLRLFTVEVHEVGTLRLVTSIEVLSPVNKRPNHEAYDEYQRKRRALLRSQAHLLEIDLLRGGTRPRLETPIPPAPYYTVLSRVQKRPRVEVWAIQLRDRLPILPIPLLEPDPDAVLDLGAAVASVYDDGGYAILIDYLKPPPSPPLSDEEKTFVNLQIESIRRR